MKKKGEIIYSKKAPQIDFEQMERDIFERFTPEERAEIDFCAREAYLRLKAQHDELIYIKIKSRLAQESNFINELIQYSKENDVDLEIFREPYTIKAHLSFDTMSHLKNLSRVLSFADGNDFRLGTNDREITLILTFYTHQCCTKEGRCLYPYKTNVPIDLNSISF